jgi:hypothetical protein
MPTPDDAMLSPPAEDEVILAGARATCPPEESRFHAHHDSTNQQPSHIDDDVENPLAQPTQVPTPQPGQPESHSHSNTSMARRTKSPDPDIEGPLRDIPTPLSAQDEAAEEQRNPQISPLSATTPAPPITWNQSSMYSSPFPSHRVRITTCRTRPKRSPILIRLTVPAEFLLLPPAARK